MCYHPIYYVTVFSKSDWKDRRVTFEKASLSDVGKYLLNLLCYHPLYYFAVTTYTIWNYDNFPNFKYCMWANTIETQYKRISCKQNARWEHLSRLKARAFFSLKKKIVVTKHYNLYLGLVTSSSGWWSPIKIKCSWWLVHIFITKTLSQ
jgi:hypothetical protein